MNGYIKYNNYNNNYYNNDEAILKKSSKLLSEQHNDCFFILKISGIWETNNVIGITYKFIETSSIRQ